MTVDEAYERLRQGREISEAFSCLVAEFRGALVAHLRHHGCEYHDAEDVAQEALGIAWEHVADFNPDWCQFLTWLCGIARRVRLHRIRSGVLANRWQRTWRICGPQSMPGPAELLVAKARREAVWRILDKLDVVDRIVLVMHKMEGLTCGQISREVNMPLGTVKKHCVRGRHRFVELVQELGVPGPTLMRWRQNGRCSDRRVLEGDAGVH